MKPVGRCTIRAQLRPSYRVVSRRVRTDSGGGLHTQAAAAGRTARAVAPASARQRRAADRADPPRPAGGVRSARRALPVAAARLLPPHARLARGRRGRPPGGLRGRVQRDPRRRARDQRAAVALPDRAQPLAEPPAAHHGDRRGLDGRPLRRRRAVDEREGPPARGVPPARRRHRASAGDAALGARAARDGRAQLRADRGRDGHDGARASSRCWSARGSASPRPPRRAS